MTARPRQWLAWCLLILMTTTSLALAQAGPARCPAAEPSAAPPGFRVTTSAEDPSLDRQTLLIAYDGPIAFPFAASLRDLWSAVPDRPIKVILDLNSPGGEIGEVEEAIAVLRDIRQSARLVTLVGQGHQCLSACVLVFAQGEDRIAGNASVWMFHSPCQLHTNVPEAASVDRFVGLLASAGINSAFTSFLMSEGHLTNPGTFWMSGHELRQLPGSNLITELLDAWQPEAPRRDLDPQIRPR